MTDLTGRTQFAKNLTITWIAHLFVVVAGFIVPRQMSDTFGPAVLGLWDLGWVTVNYLSLTNFGVAPALSREVAFLRSSGDSDKLRITCTTVYILQAFMALFVAVVALFATGHIAEIVIRDDPQMVEQATTVLRLLLLSLATKMLAMPSGGVLTGCHRWDLQNGLNGIHDFCLAAALLYCLWHEAPLTHLAWVVLYAAIILSLARTALARWKFPEIRLLSGRWDSIVAKKILVFGGNTLLIQLPSIITFQTIALFLTSAMGPSALAIINRSVALTRHIEQAIQKVAGMFSPMTSGAIGLDSNANKYDLLVKGARDCMLIALPGAIVLGFVGDLLVYLWMGPEYSNHLLTIILAFGCVLPFTQVGTTSVLIGLDAHGRMAKWTITATLISVALGIVIAYMIGWSIIVAATVLSVSRTIGTGITVQIYVARLCSVSWWKFFSDTLRFPLMLNMPFLVLMASSRFAFDLGHWHFSLLLSFLAFAITIYIYFLKVFPDNLKEKIAILVRLRKQK